ncbi:hypothetical protein GUITHDRAFT_165693 [Guillardia theta CCMP2712]|uniref:Uncharacterized protein n=1 Tax=Guillardia theta (strain CCMP2712) TaxID=905079 RepID=L1IJZ0_GUITC|nr:hypothetical protein GUITHDRAFT_165693 [Guillardia theta CCMP2712]EKX36563.1 hypothetical protein GUITHDRAFT_165693 [Guillardia theta CCMP2712]|eukprot:XP_005823543.1 hypothetical protein GUITHDRAFT_165693 [Guillardia theta CCMP2712]
MPSSMLMRYRPPLTGLESHLSGLDVLRKKDFDHKTELHKSRLKNMKPMIDNKPPATTNMKHLQFNRKKREMDFQRYSAIEKENFRLLDKMSRIMVRNAADSVFGEHTNLNCPALDGERARKRRNDKLIEQNQLIGRRLREAKPYYSLAEWDKHTNRTHSLMSHICKYPNQGKKAFEVVSLKCHPGAGTPKFCGGGHYLRSTHTKAQDADKLNDLHESAAANAKSRESASYSFEFEVKSDLTACGTIADSSKSTFSPFNEQGDSKIED